MAKLSRKGDLAHEICAVPLVATTRWWKPEILDKFLVTYTWSRRFIIMDFGRMCRFLKVIL